MLSERTGGKADKNNGGDNPDHYVPQILRYVVSYDHRVNWFRRGVVGQFNCCREPSSMGRRLGPTTLMMTEPDLRPISDVET